MASTYSKSDPANPEEFYRKAYEFWSNVSKDHAGMLGGFASLHAPDIRCSKKFINQLRTKKLLVHTGRVADCGAGIGRVTRHLLLPIFKNVVMVEPVAELLEKSVSYVGDDRRVVRVQVGMQDFHPDTSYFDMIWIQWCSGHLTDTDMVNFLSRCADGLTDDGVIVFKDNLSAQEESEFDCEDSSWTRPESLLLQLFERAGLKVVAQSMQTGFPSGMYKVKMYALKPVKMSEKT
ncbi:hypothetical protein DICVIV_01583 [Dictyocaulus viviparus]|uniref:Alpha N-terminal protein methyltransferase 1 n=1 Tax=Dictyocaulus viviparus TaxID=29172 RepID=A0A0D8Y6B2_DICVI|nr:hypothetical protein DICVIV_01583 [Dictyocaulus viviparus]